MTGRATPPSAFRAAPRTQSQPFDPFRLCVYTTVGVLAWLLTPAVVVSLLSGMGLVAYARARRAGLVSSRCKLGDTRLVMGYLAVVFLAGMGVIVYRLVALL